MPKEQDEELEPDELRAAWLEQERRRAAITAQYHQDLADSYDRYHEKLAEITPE